MTLLSADFHYSDSISIEGGLIRLCIRALLDRWMENKIVTWIVVVSLTLLLCTTPNTHPHPAFHIAEVSCSLSGLFQLFLSSSLCGRPCLSSSLFGKAHWLRALSGVDSFPSKLHGIFMPGVGVLHVFSARTEQLGEFRGMASVGEQLWIFSPSSKTPDLTGSHALGGNSVYTTRFTDRSGQHHHHGNNSSRIWLWWSHDALCTPFR